MAEARISFYGTAAKFFHDTSLLIDGEGAVRSGKTTVALTKVLALCQQYPGIYGVERNNHGLAVILKLQELKTPGLYQERPVQTKPGDYVEPGKVGWTTSSVTKPLMIDELEEGLRTGGLGLRDVLALPELTFYQTKKDGSLRRSEKTRARCYPGP